MLGCVVEIFGYAMDFEEQSLFWCWKKQNYWQIFLGIQTFEFSNINKIHKNQTVIPTEVTNLKSKLSNAVWLSVLVSRFKWESNEI